MTKQCSWERRYLAGETLRDIAKSDRYSRDTIAAHLRQHGVELRPRGPQPKAKRVRDEGLALARLSLRCPRCGAIPEDILTRNDGGADVHCARHGSQLVTSDQVARLR
jgi:hypothetical protein